MSRGDWPARRPVSPPVSNRGERSISVLDFATSRMTSKGRIPGGGSPDRGGVSPNGRQMWWIGTHREPGPAHGYLERRRIVGHLHPAPERGPGYAAGRRIGCQRRQMVRDDISYCLSEF